MAVKISEWRKINGVQTKISETKQDFSIIVISCPNNNTPIISGPFFKEVCANDTVTFSISTNDYDTKDTLRISSNNALSGAIWTDNNGQVKHPTGILKWKPGEQHASSIPYVFTVSVNDDACPVYGCSSRAYQILVKPLPKARITEVDSGCGEYHFYAESILGNSPVYQWTGNFNPGFYHTGSHFPYQFNAPGKFPYSLQMDAHGCSRIYHDTIEVDSFISLQLTPDHAICFGDTTNLIAHYEYNKGPVKFKWQNGDTNQTVSFVGVKDTIWSVEISDTTECVAKGNVRVQVHPLPLVLFTADPPHYYAQGDSFSVQFNDQSTVNNPPATYYWDFGNQTYSNLQNPLAIFQDTGNYTIELKVSDSFNCISSHVKSQYIHISDIAENSQSNNIRIYPNPTDGELYIKSTIPMQEIRLINSLGKVVMHEHDLNTREYQFDAFPKGLYLIEITSVEGIKTWNKVMFN